MDTLARYVERAFVRFPELTPLPRTPWDQMPATGLDLVRAHIEERYGPVAKLRQLDAGVLRCDLREGFAWVVRVAPSGRPLVEVEGDAAVLAFLSQHELPVERLACDSPVSEVAGRGMLVTEFVPGKQPSMAKPYTRQLGDMLGRLHALPAGPGAVSRAGGGWHSLSLEGGGRAVDLAVVDELLAAVAVGAPEHARHLDVIREELAALDLCDGLPEALTNVDLGGPNAIKAPGADPVFIDWTGSGRSPRIANLAAVAYYLTPTAIKECMAGYREHVTLEPEELEHLEGTLATHQLVLTAWGLAFRPGDAPVVVGRLGGLDDHVHKQANLIRRALN